MIILTYFHGVNNFFRSWIFIDTGDLTPLGSFKRGKADLRYALYQAALIASTRNQEFMRYSTSKLRGRKRKKRIKTKIWVKLSAKMLLIAWTLMKKKEAFDLKYLTVE